MNHNAHTWQPGLPSDLASAAINVVRSVAERLREHAQVSWQTSPPALASREPYQVAQGSAGLAIMYGYLDACFPGEGWDALAHSSLEVALRSVEQRAYLPTGLFAGLGGLAFVAWYLSRGGKRYQRLLGTLEASLFAQARTLAHQLLEQKENIAIEQFDLISGLSGVGTYLLCRQANSQAVAVLQTVLMSLVALSKEENGLPRWHTPAHLQSDERIRTKYPYGHLNCGLAHGIPGPLGLLSLACLSGIVVEGLEEAIERVADWLVQHRLDDQWGINWPTGVPITANNTVFASPTQASNPFEPGRTAWCYGSPGIARTLWFAGQALDASKYREMALAAMEAVYRRPLQVRRIDSPTFCHGVAGLLQITLRFAHDTALPQFTEAAQTLSTQLLSLYRPESLLGYTDMGPLGDRVDQSGLLDGAAGIVLVLAAIANTADPGWDRLFLLS